MNSFDRQKVLAEADPVLNLPQLPKLGDSIRAFGFNPRAIDDFDKKMIEWRQRAQQELAKRFAEPQSNTTTSTPPAIISPTNPAVVILNSGENVRLKKGVGFQWFNPGDSKWYTEVISGVPPVVGLAAVGEL